MNPYHNGTKPDTRHPLPDENHIRDIWNQARVTDGPKRETMDQIRDLIHAQASHNKAHAAPRGLAIPFVAWRPVLAAAAGLLVLLGALHLRPQATQTVRHDIAMVDNQIKQELDELEATVWDVLAELEADALSDDFLLHALTMQNTIYEEL